MPDREKVIKGLEEMANDQWLIRHADYYSMIATDALELLKEQEAIKPYMDYDGQDVWRCGKCGNSLMHPSYYESDEDPKNYIKYCNHCGKKVKWDN